MHPMTPTDAKHIIAARLWPRHRPKQRPRRDSSDLDRAVLDIVRQWTEQLGFTEKAFLIGGYFDTVDILLRRDYGADAAAINAAQITLTREFERVCSAFDHIPETVDYSDDALCCAASDELNRLLAPYQRNATDDELILLAQMLTTMQASSANGQSP